MIVCRECMIPRNSSYQFVEHGEKPIFYAKLLDYSCVMIIAVLVPGALTITYIHGNVQSVHCLHHRRHCHPCRRHFRHHRLRQCHHRRHRHRHHHRRRHHLPHVQKYGIVLLLMTVAITTPNVIYM